MEISSAFETPESVDDRTQMFQSMLLVQASQNLKLEKLRSLNVLSTICLKLVGPGVLSRRASLLYMSSSFYLNVEYRTQPYTSNLKAILRFA